MNKNKVHIYPKANLDYQVAENGIFSFWLEIPLALGTVGGLTSLHPMVKLNLEILEKPTPKEFESFTMFKEEFERSVINLYPSYEKDIK